MTLPEIDPAPETETTTIVCGATKTFNKDIRKHRTFFCPTSDTWPPAGWAGLTQAQKNALMNDVALNCLNSCQAGQDIANAMRETCRLSVLNDANIVCAPCVDVPNTDNDGLCKKEVPTPAVIPPGPGSPAPEPVVSGGSIAGMTIGGVAGFMVTATFWFMYAVKVVCNKDACRCTGCGQFHPNPDQ